MLLDIKRFLREAFRAQRSAVVAIVSAEYHGTKLYIHGHVTAACNDRFSGCMSSRLAAWIAGSGPELEVT